MRVKEENNMKKTIALLLSLTMLLCLCACGQSRESVSGTLTQAVEQAPAPAQELEQAPAPEESAAPEAETQEEPVQGTVSGSRYENAALGIGCELDGSWTIADDEQLAAMVGITADAFDDETYREQMKSADMFYDLFIQREDGLANVNIVIQNLGLLYGSVLSEEQYLQASTQTLKEQLESAGFTDISWESCTVDFAGAERNGLRMSYQVQGIQSSALQVYIKSGSYMGIITLTSFLEDETDALAQLFYALP